MSGHWRTFAPRPSCAHQGADTGAEVLADSASGAELVRDNLRRMARLGWAANAVGSVAVFTAIGFLIPIFADADEASRLGLANLPFLLAYFLVAGIAIRRYLNRFTRARWRGSLRAGSPPRPSTATRSRSTRWGSRSTRSRG